MTLWLDAGAGQAYFDGQQISVDLTVPGRITYELIDQLLGVSEVDDYTESLTEELQAAIRLSGQYVPSEAFYQGALHFGFGESAPLLNVVFGGFMQKQGLLFAVTPNPQQGPCPKEVCIQITYETEAAKTAWQNDVDTMIDGARTIWKACGINVRTKLKTKEKCVSVVLRETWNEGGGGTCKGKAKGGNGVINIGRNVLETCQGQGVTTTYGQVLAHELGHALGLPQKPGTGALMDNCAPSATISKDCCREACKLATAVQSIEDAQSNTARIAGFKPMVTEKEYTFKNRTNQTANDLHLSFNQAVWLDSATGPFKDHAGSSMKELDFGRGDVAANDTVTVKVKSLEKSVKPKECWWTKDGANIGACRPE